MYAIPTNDEARLVTLINNPATTHRRWDERAACAGEPSNAYFPEDDNLAPVDALARCVGCPVTHECLATALIHEAQGDGYRYGWWGGIGPKERDALAERLGIPTTPVESELCCPADLARHLRAQNRTIPLIAAELGCTERTVYRYLAASAA